MFNGLMRPFRLLSRDLKENCLVTCLIWSGLKIPRDKEERTPKFHEELSEAQSTSATRARRGQRISQLCAALAISCRPC